MPGRSPHQFLELQLHDGLCVSVFPTTVGVIAEIPQQGVSRHGSSQGAGRQPIQEEDEQAEAHHSAGEG